MKIQAIPDEERIRIYKYICDKHGKVPQDYQMEVLCDRSPRILIIKGASLGMSDTVSLKKVFDAIERKKQYFFVSIRRENVLNLINYMHSHYNDIAEVSSVPEKIVGAKNEIALANGSQLLSLPADPDAMRTWHGDGVLDEIDFAFDIRKLLATARGRCKPPPAQLIALTTCNESGREIEKLYRKELEKEESERRWKIYTIPYTRCTIPGYKFDIDREREEAIEDGTLDEWEREYTCKWADSSSKLYGWDLIGSCVGHTDYDSTLKIDYLGVDFGARVDETVLRCVGRINETIVIFKKKFVSKAGYTEQLYSIKTLIKELSPIRVYIDKTAIGIRLEEELKESEIGHLIEGIHFNPDTKEKMAMFLYSKMTGGKIILPNDQKLLEQIHGIKRTKTATGRKQYTHEAHKHDDEFWAMCLALMGYIEDTTTDNARIVTCGNTPRRAKPSNRKEAHIKKKRGYSLGGVKLWD